MDDNNRWMLANCFIRLGKINKAIEQYELLQKPGSIFEKQASDSIQKYKNLMKWLQGAIMPDKAVNNSQNAYLSNFR